MPGVLPPCPNGYPSTGNCMCNGVQHYLNLAKDECVANCNGIGEIQSTPDDVGRCECNTNVYFELVGTSC